MTLALKATPVQLTVSCSPDGSLTVYGPSPFTINPVDTARLRDYLNEKLTVAQDASEPDGKAVL
jgi:hypothetical protein